MEPCKEEGTTRFVPDGLIFRIVISAPSLTDVESVGVSPMDIVLVFVKDTGMIRPLPVMVMVCETPALEVPSSCTLLLALPCGMGESN